MNLKCEINGNDLDIRMRDYFKAKRINKHINEALDILHKYDNTFMGKCEFTYYTKPLLSVKILSKPTGTYFIFNGRGKFKKDKFYTYIIKPLVHKYFESIHKSTI